MRRRDVVLGAVAMAALLAAAALAHGWRRAAWRAGLTADSLEAARDTTRLIPGLVFGMVAWERRAVQAELARDTLDRQLRRTTAALVRASVAVDSFAASIVSAKPVTVTGGDVRAGTFEMYRAPYTVRATVSLPPPPANGFIELAIRLDPIDLDMRLMCGERAKDGVAPATALVLSPPWAPVRLATVQQSPEVCSPAPAAVTLPRLPRWTRVAVPVAAFVAGVYVGSR